MIRKMSLAIFTILVHGLVFGQQTFTGRVTDANHGTPVPGATIEIENKGTILSDENGVFNVHITPGTYDVYISSIGYKSLNKQADFTKGSADFKLEQFNLFLQPVEIRAIRAGDKAPFTKTNINKKEIEKLNLAQDLPFLLNQTPSVLVYSDAGNGVGYTGLRIRGTDLSRINTTLNGIPYNDAESQGAYFVDLPDIASSINSIQIQRGVGTSSNGAGAFGATLNISTNEFREEAYGEISNSYGSFNTWKHTIKAGTGLLNDHFTIDARLSKISSDGFIDRASSDLRSYYLSGAYLSKRSSLRFNMFSGAEKTYQAWYGILQTDLGKSRTYNSAGTEKPGTPYDNETDNYKQDHYQLFFNHAFNEYLSFNSAAFLTRGKGYYEQYKAGAAFSDYGLHNLIAGSDTLRETDLVRQLWLDNYFYGNITSLQYRKNNLQLTIGGGINRYDASHYGKIIWALAGSQKDHRWYDLDAFKTDGNIYIKLQQKLALHWEGFADLQYRSVSYKINGFRDNPDLKILNRYHFLNPKLGVAYNNNNWNGYLSYSVGNKEPNRDDFEAGVAQKPKPETLHDFELGVGKSSTLFSWGATFYYMLYRDQLVLTGKVNDVGAYTRTNIPRSFRKGVELQAAGTITEWMFASGNLSFSSNKVLNFTEFVDDYDNGGQKSYQYNKTDIAFSPSIIGSGMLRFLPLKNAEISLIGKYAGRQNLDNTGNSSRSLPGFYIQDLRMMYTLKNQLLKETNIILQVNNLFNKKYEPNGYTFSYISDGSLQTANYVYPMAGINWMLGVNIKL